MRERVGIERTILCATRFWAVPAAAPTRQKVGKLWSYVPAWGPGPTTATLLKGVRHVVRKQGFSGPEVTKALQKLERGGFVRIGGAHSAKTIALTEKGGRVGCASVKLAPWTDDGYAGSALKGASCGCSRR